MHNVLHHCAILQSCCQQFLPQIPASIPACVRPKARQQKFSAEILSRNSWWAGNRSWVCCWCEAELVWIAAVQADSLVGIVFPQDSAQGNLLESGLGITSGSSSSPALLCAVSSTLWVGHDSFFLVFFFLQSHQIPPVSFPSFASMWVEPPAAHFPFYFCCLSPLKLCQL